MERDRTLKKNMNADRDRRAVRHAAEICPPPVGEKPIEVAKTARLTET